MERIPWEVNNSIVISDAYIAGFLDGDGSLVARIEKRPQRRRFPYRVRLKINFTQHIRYKWLLYSINGALDNAGAIREIPQHNLAELVIQKREELKRIINRLTPHLVLKQRQARLMLGMVDIFDANTVNVRSSLSDKDFAKVFAMAMELRKLNSNTGGKKTEAELFGPVTTDVATTMQHDGSI